MKVTWGTLMGCVFLALSGCGSGTDTCVPGRQLSCGCPGGLVGVRVCNTSGTDYGVCQACAPLVTGVAGSGGAPVQPGTGGLPMTTPGTGGTGGTPMMTMDNTCMIGGQVVLDGDTACDDNRVKACAMGEVQELRDCDSCKYTGAGSGSKYSTSCRSGQGNAPPEGWDPEKYWAGAGCYFGSTSSCNARSVDLCNADCDCGTCWFCESGECRYGGKGPSGCYRGCRD